MLRTLISSTYFIVLCAVSTSAYSAIVDNGSYTTVTATGLDWLDLTETSNRSYNDIYSQLGSGGEFSGWRYASLAEMNALLDAFGGDGNYYHSGNNGLFEMLAPYWGDLKCEFEGCLIGDGSNDFYYHQTVTNNVVMLGNINDISQINIHSGQDVSLIYDQINLGGPSGGPFNIANPNLGHALVRATAVPLPAAVWFFSSALFALSLLRNKTRA